MSTDFREALKFIFNKDYDENNPESQLLDLVPSESLIVYKRFQIIIEQNSPAKYFYLLLSGHASVLNNIPWINNNIIDYVHALDVLGLVEYLNGIPNYTAYVVALENCTVLRVPVEYFSQIIQQDASICYQTLQVLGRVASENMNRAEVKCLLLQKEVLEHYLFLQAQINGVPYTLPITKKALSEKLRINLRTLHRYFSTLEANGTVKSKNKKVIIDETGFEVLKKRYENIVL